MILVAFVIIIVIGALAYWGRSVQVSSKIETKPSCSYPAGLVLGDLSHKAYSTNICIENDDGDLKIGRFCFDRGTSEDGENKLPEESLKSCPEPSGTYFMVKEAHIVVSLCPSRQVLYGWDLNGELSPPAWKFWKQDFWHASSQSQFNLWSFPSEAAIFRCLPQDGDINIADDYFVTWIRPQKSNRFSTLQETGPHPLDVIVLFLDGFSRAEFNLYLPNTISYLASLNDSISSGVKTFYFPFLNSVASSTRAFTRTALGGTRIEESEIVSTCVDHWFWKHWPWCGTVPWVWDVLEQHGYMTLISDAFCDNWSFNNAVFTHSLFNAFCKTHPARENGIQYHTPVNNGTPVCVGAIDTPTYIFQHAQQFHRAYAGKKNTFSLSSVFEGHSGTDKRRAIQLLDRPVKTFIKDMHCSLQHSVLVLLSDHGGDPKDRTLPLLHLTFPRWWLEMYPDAHRALSINQERIVANMDIWATLTDMATYPNLYNRESFQRGFVSDVFSPPGLPLSLLREIPSTRTFEDAGIPIAYCQVCSWKELETNNPEVVQSAEFVVSVLNSNHGLSDGVCRLQSIRNIKWSFGFEQFIHLMIVTTESFSYDAIVAKVADGFRLEEMTTVTTYDPHKACTPPNIPVDRCLCAAIE